MPATSTATGQNLLDMMEVLNQELQLQTSESDQTRGLAALNMAQDYFESLASQYPRVLGDTTADVVTVNNTETTNWPDKFLRLDRMQYIDSTTSRPGWDLVDIRKVGGHATTRYWPWNVVSSTQSGGKPRGYYTNGGNIYWAPLPDGAYTVRAYGFKQADAITVTTWTHYYPDTVFLPIAAFATQLLKIGVDDDPVNVKTLADQCFGDAIKSLRASVKDGPTPWVYTQVHEA